MWAGATRACALIVIAGVHLTAGAAVMLPEFGPATPVAELNSTWNDVADWVSPDGLRIIFHSQRALTGDQLFGATRASTALPFGPPSTAQFINNNLASHDVRWGELSSSGLELFYSDAALPGFARVMRATRADTTSPFSAGVPVDGLETGSDNYYPQHLSSDGLRLYYMRSFSSDAYVAARSGVGAAFGPPSAAPFANIPGVFSFSLTPNELEMYYGWGTKLYWTSRANVASPFATGQEITSLTGPNLDGPLIFGDTLIFYQNGEIYQARMIPEPGAGLVLAAAGAAALWAKRRRRPRRRSGA